MICGSARIWSSKMRLDRGSCRLSVAVTYTCSGNPAAAGSSWALMIRMTPGLLQPADPVQRRRGGQPDQAGQLHVRAVRVGLQRGEQLYVNFIKFNGHITIYYLAKAL